MGPFSKKLGLGLLLYFCLCDFSLKAQQYAPLITEELRQQYTFINWEANRLAFYGRSPSFEQFFNKLSKVYYNCEQRLNVFHIGGSHIQADIYSHQTRVFLQQLGECTQGDRGLLFPYRLAGTNNPGNYRVSYSGDWSGTRNLRSKDDAVLGLLGISASTNDQEASFSISFPASRAKIPYKHNCVKVLHNTENRAYKVTLSKASNVLAEYTNQSQGYTMIYLKEAKAEIELLVQKEAPSSSEFTLYGVELSNLDKSSGLTYHSIGVNGASFPSYLRCSAFERQLRQVRPDLFIISIGTNDSYSTKFDPDYYEKNYEKFLSILRRVNPNVAVILTVPNDCYLYKRRPNPSVKKVRDVIVKLAKKYQYPVWDFYTIMGGYGSSQRWYRNSLMPSDRIHFTHRGYKIKGKLFIDAFMRAWKNFQRGDYITDVLQEAENN